MKIHFRASKDSSAQDALKKFTKHCGQVKNPKFADSIVPLGGDGTALGALKYSIRYDKPVFGLNYGGLGFLLNSVNEVEDLKNLPKRIEAAEKVKLHPLRFEAEFYNGKIVKDFAINEVSICHHKSRSTVRLNLYIDGELRMKEVNGDGIIIATPVGSTAYNRGAGGCILPLDFDALAVTPNNAKASGYEPCMIPSSLVEIEVAKRDHDHLGNMDYDNRCAGKDLLRVKIYVDPKPFDLLFDPGTIREKVRRIQFGVPGVR